MTTSTVQSLAPAQRRRLVTLALLRSFATTVVLVALYYVLPLDRLTRVSLAVVLTVGVLVLVVVSSWQVRRIVAARYPGVRAVEALAVTAPLFLLLFASAYYLMARSVPGSFSGALTRTDSLYFTVSTFSTVGFGDITAVSEAARLVVTAQMILDLLVLGLGIRVFVGAVQLGRQRAHQDTADPGDSPAPPPQQP
jgi:voltage-gated potassium channel